MAEKNNAAQQTSRLRKLLALEQGAQEKIRTAEEQSAEILIKARETAGGILGGTRTGAEKQADKLVEQAESETQQQVTGIINQAQAQAAELLEQAQSRQDELVKLLVSWITAASQEERT